VGIENFTQSKKFIMTTPSLVWFILYDPDTGLPYKGTSADATYLEAGSLIVQFRKAVKVEYDQPNYLKDIPAGALVVYKNKAAFDKRNSANDNEKVRIFFKIKSQEEPLKVSSPLTGLGQSDEEALIVVVPSSILTYDQIDSEIYGDPYPTTMIDGIDLRANHLERKKLVEYVQRQVHANSIVLMSSSPGSGKSSMYKLFKAASKDLTVIYISLMNQGTAYESLRRRGLDLELLTCSKNLLKNKIVFFMDDAQKKYGEISFWESLCKGSGQWIPTNIKFLISATYDFSAGVESPVEFRSLPRVERGDFLLSDEEGYQLLEFPDAGLPPNIRHHKILKEVLVKECGGLVGALRMSIHAFINEIHSSKNGAIDEASCLQYCFSDSFAQHMARCFGSNHLNPVGNDLKSFLKALFGNKNLCSYSFESAQDNKIFSALKKAGILADLSGNSVGFSSPLAKRYYFKWIFPKRTPDAPSSLRELIEKVISSMSSSVLKNSTLGEFPKEAVFQHLFMEGLALYTSPGCSICPELSKVFPSSANLNTKQQIAGEIDFYVNGNLRWGIELLVNGDGVGEHLDRFSPPDGKYVPLNVNDYAIVDFRCSASGQPTNIVMNSRRISVFFKNGDFSVAQCIFGHDPESIEIHLAN
jgi:hypothetical protein